MEQLSLILSSMERAFGWRQPPQCLINSTELSPQEKGTALRFQGRDWRDLNCKELQEDHDIVFLLSPEAFCYFLPGIFSATIRESRPDLLINESIVQMLDRDPDPNTWDDFFLPRWTNLTFVECDAVEQWLWWLHGHPAGDFREDAILRSTETLNLLRRCYRPN